MKKYIYHMLLVVAIMGQSCMKDKTNMDIKPVDAIAIDTAGIARDFIVFQLDSFKLKPKVTKPGTDASNLKYEWTVNAYGGYKRLVGKERDLAAKITEAPGNYMLIYTVTDPKTNLKAFFSWSILVNSPFGSGLIVVDTRDGANSDYNLIMTYNFTPGIADSVTKIYRNLYSDANATKITGIVKSVSYMKYGNDRILTGLTDNSIIRVDPLSYKNTMRDNQCFLLPPDRISPSKIQSIQPTNQHEYIVNNGKVHSRYGNTAAFGYRFLADRLDYNCNNICGLQRPVVAGALLYDEQNNRFLMTPTMTSTSTPLIVFPAIDNNGVAPAFDPGNMGNKTCLHLEEGQDNRVLAVMKDKSGVKYYVYQVILAPLSGKMGYSLNDISNNQEIGNSKYYTCSSSENVLFYATESQVYATTLLVNGGTDASLRYTVPAGDKITGMQIHRRQGDLFLPSLENPSDFTKRRSMASANRLLVLSTYNEGTKTGKIITIPIETLGVGGLVTNPLYINTYSGFGRITAFTNQDQ